MSKHDPVHQRDRLLEKYDVRGALKAANTNAANAVSEAQEEFWERVAELIVNQCPDMCHIEADTGKARCSTCGDLL